eukprot:7654799-Karenia_brevis.AAC.1
MPVFVKGVAGCQRGFVKNRDISLNILELDTWSRVYDKQISSAKRPGVLAFWDFSQAFPSVCIAWLWLVLEALGCPKGYL